MLQLEEVINPDKSNIVLIFFQMSELGEGSAAD